MKFIDLKKLDIKRLKTYRKSILAKISGFEICYCGSSFCDYGIGCNKDNPDYINLCLVRDRVIKELSTRQMKEHNIIKQKASVNVPVIRKNRGYLCDTKLD